MFIIYPKSGFVYTYTPFLRSFKSFFTKRTKIKGDFLCSQRNGIFHPAGADFIYARFLYLPQNY